MPTSNLIPQRAPLRSVVVATDFSPGGDSALNRVARLPLAPGARISIVHVLPSDLPLRRRGAATIFAGQRLERAVGRFADAAREAGNPEVRLTGHLARGRPFVEIVRTARRRRAELLVLGRHGRRTFEHLLIGTTAQRVLRASDAPVLVVNRETMDPYRRPLLATDLESTSRGLAELAARLLDPECDGLSIIHAYEVPFEGWIVLGDHGAGRARYHESYRRAAASDLRRFLGSLKDLGLQLRSRVQFGDPRRVVLAEARRRRADLLILGTHGRSGLTRALLGTVAEAVVAEATCDLLIARPRGLAVRLP